MNKKNDIIIKREDLEEIVLLIDNNIFDENTITYIQQVLKLYQNSQVSKFKEDSYKYFESFVFEYLKNNFHKYKDIIKDDNEKEKLFIDLLPSFKDLKNKIQRLQKFNYKILDCSGFFKDINNIYIESKNQNLDIVFKEIFNALLTLFNNDISNITAFYLSDIIDNNIKEIIYNKLLQENKSTFKNVLDTLCQIDEIKGTPGLFSLNEDFNMKYPFIKLICKVVNINSNEKEFEGRFYFFTTLYEILTWITLEHKINYRLYQIHLVVDSKDIEIDYKMHSMNLYEIIQNNDSLTTFILKFNEKHKEANSNAATNVITQIRKSIEQQLVHNPLSYMKIKYQNFLTFDNSFYYTYLFMKKEYILAKHMNPTETLRYKIYPHSKVFITQNNNETTKQRQYCELIETSFPKIRININNIYTFNETEHTNSIFTEKFIMSALNDKLNNFISKFQEINPKLKIISLTSINSFSFKTYEQQYNTIQMILIETKKHSFKLGYIIKQPKSKTYIRLKIQSKETENEIELNQTTIENEINNLTKSIKTLTIIGI